MYCSDDLIEFQTMFLTVMNGIYHCEIKTGSEWYDHFLKDIPQYKSSDNINKQKSNLSGLYENQILCRGSF